MTEKDLIRKLQVAMNALGENLTVDGDYGPKTEAALDKFDVTFELSRKPQQAPSPQPPSPVPNDPKSPPWYAFALKFKGKKETDKEFSKFMVPKWKLFGMDLGTIAQNWAAWCGLAMAVALSGVGVDYAKNGSLAKNWAKYGVAIEWRVDGIPQGAIVHVNKNCASSENNHVSQANGYCTAADLLKPGATIDLYGGNQGNTWKVSTYNARHICAVRWPKDVKDYPPPGKIVRSLKCSSAAVDNESTR